MQTFKQQVYDQLAKQLQQKISELQQVLADLKEMGANETKSTAGDKHETALAMLQIEQANKRTLLQELIQQQEQLHKIDPTVRAAMVLTGSLVKTNRGFVFIAVALGKANIAGIQVMAVSPQSPLAVALMRHAAGESVVVNGNSFTIESLE